MGIIKNNKRSSVECYKRRVMRQMMKSKVLPVGRGKAIDGTSFWDQFLQDVCKNSSFHGLNHFVDVERHTIEKICWGCVLICAVVGAVYSAHEIWHSYLHSTTETVVETTYFKISNIAFPAIIVCDTSRVHWARVLALNESVVPEYTNETAPAIRALLKALSVTSFGDFDDFDRIKKYKSLLPKLKTLKMSELLLKVMRPCHEIFIDDCWWRSHKVDCCSIFELQKTEFGYCYSFNSDLSQFSKKLSLANAGINSYWRDPDGILRPRRTGSRGLWSGLRIAVSTPPMDELPPDTDAKPGIKVLVGEPRTYVMGGEVTIPAGQFGNMQIWGDRIYSTERMRQMKPEQRNCLFSDEEQSLGMPYYFRQNCKVDCYKQHMYKYCKCSPDFMLFEKNDNNPTFPICTVEDMLCLNEHNLIFNNLIPNFAHSFFDGNESGMMCDCVADCTHQMYNAEVTGAEESNSSKEVLLDIHFRQATCILYRSDIVFGILDLLVAFGGCAGLFLGGSLLTCIELLYFFTLRLYYHWTNYRKKEKYPDISTQLVNQYVPSSIDTEAKKDPFRLRY